MPPLTCIECFHSRGLHLCKFIETKESVCIRKEFNSQRTGLGHQHGRRFIVLGHQYGRRDVMWKHFILQFFGGHLDTRECIKLPGTREIGSGDRPLLNFFIEFIRVKPSSEKRWRSFCAYSFHRNTNHRNAEGMLLMSPTYFCDAAISPLSFSITDIDKSVTQALPWSECTESQE